MKLVSVVSILHNCCNVVRICTQRGIATSSKRFLMQGKLLIIEGNIAAGKSILAKRLGQYLNYKVHEEPAPKNPYIAKFYKEPLKYSLKLQLWLFKQRFMMYLNALQHIKDTGHGVIMDRSIYSDLVFTNAVYKDGKMSKDGYNYYLKVRQKLMDGLITPFAIIYLDVSPLICAKRIIERGRDYEQQIPLAYLDLLDKEHKEVFRDLSINQGCPVLTYDWSDFGFIKKLETRDSNLDASFQYYDTGFNKIIEDISCMSKMSWLPLIPERFKQFCKTPDLIENESKVDGYDHILEQIPDD